MATLHLLMDQQTPIWHRTNVTVLSHFSDGWWRGGYEHEMSSSLYCNSVKLSSKLRFHSRGSITLSRSAILFQFFRFFVWALWLSFFVLPAKWKDKIITRWDSRFFPFSVVFALIVSAAAAGLVPVFMTVLNWHYQLYPESPGRTSQDEPSLFFFSLNTGGARGQK